MSPFEIHHCYKPNLTWLRPFGCSSTVYIRDHKELIPHRKLSPRGEACMYLGLRFSPDFKSLVCWNLVNNRVHITHNAVFNETFMLAKDHDQLILRHYDTTQRTKLATATHGSMEVAPQQ